VRKDASEAYAFAAKCHWRRNECEEECIRKGKLQAWAAGQQAIKVQGCKAKEEQLYKASLTPTQKTCECTVLKYMMLPSFERCVNKATERMVHGRSSDSNSRCV
jgi:hypothetical protein